MDTGQYVSLSPLSPLSSLLSPLSSLSLLSFLSPLLSPLSYKFIAKFEEALSELHRHLHQPLLAGEFIKYCCIQD